jgi:hypothetical protein
MLVPIVGFYECQSTITKRNSFKTLLAGVDEARKIIGPCNGLSNVSIDPPSPVARLLDEALPMRCAYYCFW